jgi:hypothetical protein
LAALPLAYADGGGVVLIVVKLSVGEEKRISRLTKFFPTNKENAI